jgi:hypothetical protein
MRTAECTSKELGDFILESFFFRGLGISWIRGGSPWQKSGRQIWNDASSGVDELSLGTPNMPGRVKDVKGLEWICQRCGNGQPSSRFSIGVGSRRAYGVGTTVPFGCIEFGNDNNENLIFIIIISKFKMVNDCVCSCHVSTCFASSGRRRAGRSVIRWRTYLRDLHCAV